MGDPRGRSNKNIKTVSDLIQTSIEEPANKTTIDTQQQTPKIETIDNPTILFIEAFYGGSHKQLIDLIVKNTSKSYLVALSAKKWHWRGRCSALILSSLIPKISTEQVLFCSSVVSLAELLGLRPDLQQLRKIIYFHENQLVYPVREIKERDIQFAYNQITTCLAADVVLFNSQYNKNSFLDNIKKIIKLLPDYQPKNLRTKIEPKCSVLYFPLELREAPTHVAVPRVALHIVWPHRWEFDKDPEALINILLRLKSENLSFRISLVGESFTEVPEIFSRAKELLRDEIVNFGFLQAKEDYYKVLQSSQVAVSTAKHEFFGVSMLEASFYGCFPLVPNRLVYPEIYPAQCLYSNANDLYLRLKEYCMEPQLALKHRQTLNLDFHKFSVDNLLPKYLDVLY